MEHVDRDTDSAAGQAMYDFVSELFPVCRSLTGEGVRHTLAAIHEHLPGLAIHEVPSGTEVFDWRVPDEWNIRSARLIGPDGKTIVDFKNNNLHVVGYSEPVDIELPLEELQLHLHSLPELPDAIPYVTCYYKRYWGFCLPHRLRETLSPGRYRAVIDATLEPGHLTYGELILHGMTDHEILLSTYICHPSLANNELSGPAVATWLAKWLMKKPRRHTYRIVFIPETIGSITYLSRNMRRMKDNTIAGFNLTCMGDNRCFSYLPSRLGGTLADQTAKHVLKHIAPDYISYSFRERGSDERQYCSPGIDLPVCTVMRSKYGTYPEYHTSLDDLKFVTPSGLGASFEALRLCLYCLEQNDTMIAAVMCEPQLAKRGLYPNISTGGRNDLVRNMMDLLAYSDGKHDLLTIADMIDVPMWELIDLTEKLKANGLLHQFSNTADG